MASGVMTLTDTTRADFEAGTRVNLDTAVISGTVRLAWRPLPVANAGADQTVAENSSVTLNGSASSSSLGEPLTYTWTQLQGTPITLFQTGTASPTFVAPNLTRNETLVFQLVVHDQAARSAPDTVAVTVTVSGQNDPPTAEAGADQTVREGNLVTLDCTGSYDPNGDTLSYAWRQTAGTLATLSSVHACRPTFLAPNISRSESLAFELVVNDGQADSAPDVTHVLVAAYNDPPVADAGPNQTVDRGALVGLSGEKSRDPNGDPLTYEWSQTAGSGVTLNGGNTSDPYFLAPYVSSDETLGFRLTVRDSVSSASASVSVTVRATTSPLLGAPLISNFNPSSGLPGALATVEGSNFVATN
jgi:hypothetical protein